MKNKKIVFVLIFVLIIDIFSKLLISNFMLEDQSVTIIDKFFYFTYAKNTGVAFSFLEGNISFIILSTFFIIVILVKYIYSRTLSVLEQVSYGFIIGGALGNLVDRIVYGYVIDFLDFYILGYNYPIFNVADCAIVIGIIMLLIISIRMESSDKNENSGRVSRSDR